MRWIKVSGGLHWVWSSVVNALSTKMEATVEREWEIFYQSYKEWIPDENVKAIWKSKKHWTTIRFYPDATIFKETIKFDYNTILKRLKEIGFEKPSSIQEKAIPLI